LWCVILAEGIELTVASALVTDDGRGVARIDSKARKILGLISGDVIEIKGKRKSTAAVVWQTHQQDEGLDFIRIDGYLNRRPCICHKGRCQECREGCNSPTAKPENSNIS
jgi:hypothetical protein